MLHVRQLDIYVSIILISLGVYVTYEGLGYGYVERGTPSAGFFPFWVGIGLAVFSAINLYRTVRRHGLIRPDVAIDAIAYGEIGKVLGASAIMAAFIGLSLVVGMTPSIFLLMLAIGAVFGPRNIRFYLGLTALSLAMTAILYFTFAYLLGVPLL
ncbi:MAG: tripartite tricarboxylate transporter TctB family protein [Xanthobacteraceae bacterium]